jgi:hypothetical protein
MKLRKEIWSTERNCMLPVGDIVEALRDYNDALSLWAADVIVHLRNLRLSQKRNSSRAHVEKTKTSRGKEKK